jgi:hypothetical protein
VKWRSASTARGPSSACDLDRNRAADPLRQPSALGEAVTEREPAQVQRGDRGDNWRRAPAAAPRCGRDVRADQRDRDHAHQRRDGRDGPHRAVSIEVGMQNSGLGAVLADRHFTTPTTGLCPAAAPCAISAVIHSLIGSLLAAWWRRRPTEDAESETPEGS